MIPKSWCGIIALALGGATGSFHRAWRSPTQETWAERRVFGWRVPSQKTASDILIGALCSIGLPKFGDAFLPDFLNLQISAMHPGAQWLIAHGIAFVVSWEATVRGWILRERGREPEIKNAAPAVPLINLQPAKSVDEIKQEARDEKESHS